MTVGPAPDLFPAPMREFQSSNRPTPEEMGGWSLRPEHEQAAHHMGDVAAAGNDDDALAANLRRRIEQSRPRRIWLTGSGVGTSADPAIIRMGGPKPGSVRAVRRVTVGPADYLNIATGPTRVILLITSVAASVAAPVSASRVVSSTTSWPAEGTWGRGELVLEQGEELVALILGSSNGVTYTAGGQAEETAVATGETYEL